MENKTILIFSAYSLPHLGGIERYIDNLSKQLTNYNYNIIIVSSDFEFKGKKIVTEANITYITIPVYKLFISRYPIPKKNKELKEIFEYLDKFEIYSVIVNTRFHLTSLLGAKYAKKRNIPIFLIEHGSQHLTVDNKILDFFGAMYEHCLTKYIKKYVQYYFGVSKAACEWQKHFKINSDGVWYNSIHDFTTDLKIKKSNKTINILYAGRLLKQKGIYELLDSFCELSKDRKNINLIIAGDGNQFDNIKKNYSLNKNIKLLGKINFDKLKKEYAKADIFVYAPKWPEGLPTSILEAGLCNCAVIASPQGGINEIIRDNENGLMINSKEELKLALDNLIVNKGLRKKLANNLKKTVSKNFLWEVTAKKIINDINERVEKK